ncbi:MAG: NUDIX domain-containing protein [Chloroflexi bacterium]|nr:NUDIX domain-containing protein [Chloroflexota bacterium]MYK36077.1 NUDIX domain-containing protein [Chloroflexota bacterium]
MPTPEGQATIAPCVAGAMVRGGRVLLAKRSSTARHYPDVWDLFGGHVEEGEPLEEALRREAREELGVDIEAFHPLGIVHDPVEPAEIAIFAVTAWRGEPVNAALDEHSAIG